MSDCPSCFILSAAEILGYKTNVSRHELCACPLLQDTSVVGADGINRRDKIPAFPHPRIEFPVPWKLFPVTNLREFVTNPLNSHVKIGYRRPKSAEKCKNSLFFPVKQGIQPETGSLQTACTASRMRSIIQQIAARARDKPGCRNAHFDFLSELPHAMGPLVTDYGRSGRFTPVSPPCAAPLCKSSLTGDAGGAGFQ